MQRRKFITLIGGAVATQTALPRPTRAEVSTKRPLLAVLAGVTRKEFPTSFVNVASSDIARREVESASKRLGVKLVSAEVREPNDLDTAFKQLSNERVQAVVILGDAMLFQERQRVAELAAAARLPAVHGFRDHVDAGGLTSYGVNYAENFRRAAIYVVKILKGAKPSDLPVEFPNKLELVINLKAATALGLDIPPTLLARADDVIE
jgi:putative tryptophan/tyrosine transport system substrate-binding protein